MTAEQRSHDPLAGPGHPSNDGNRSTQKASPTRTGISYEPNQQSYPSGNNPDDTAQSLVYIGPTPDLDPSSFDRDSGLGSYASTRSTAATDGAYDYREEHGRRYHAPRGDAEYHLPNDDKELDRLDLQHHLFQLTLNGSLHKAPLDKDIHAALDIGTGSGIWAIDFAQEYPSASVIGTDLSPVQPAYVPPNCRFYIENAEDPWNFEHKFDYIHGRMLVVGIRNWKNLFQQAFDNLKPGGWLEVQDLNFPARCDDNSAPQDSPLMQWSSLMMQGAGKVGIDLEASSTFAQLLTAAGFVDVQSETHAWPLGQWPKGEKMKGIGAFALQNFLNGVTGFSLAYFTRGLGWDKDKVMEMVENVTVQLKDRNSHAYLPISIFWARKSETAEE